ncbi:MAG: hypothetical protein V4722_17205 [Bacteroidota bacterium]
MQKIIIATSLLLLGSCRSNEIGNSKDVNPEAIYQEYSITATEGEEYADLTAQFRFGGSNGTTLVLNDDSYISLDGKKLDVDSSGFLGAFYKTRAKIPASPTDHEWAFADGKDKTYHNGFRLASFGLTNKFDKPLKPEDLELNFTGFDENDSIHLNISDTSSLAAFRDIDTVLRITAGRAMVPGEQMKRLSTGPLTIQIVKYKNLSLAEATKEGGAINYSFEFKTREAFLKK